MPRQRLHWLAAATLSGAVALAAAQSPDPAGPPSAPSQVQNDQNYTQSQPAPIQREPDAAPDASQDRSWSGPTVAPQPRPRSTNGPNQIIPGVLLRVGNNSTVSEVAKTPERVELRVNRGLANLNVHDPGKDILILVDLPGGQTQILKNGLYTFNADTNTVRVLKGEAKAFPEVAAADTHDKGIKVKEDHKVVFSGDHIKSQDFYPVEAEADLIPGAIPYGHRNEGVYGEPGYMAYGPYGWGPYGDGFYGYPYDFAYGPYGWGYPYGYGLGLGLGFGYYGGYHGGFGGYRGFHDHDGDHDGGFHGGGGGFHGGGGGFHGGGGASRGGGGSHR